MIDKNVSDVKKKVQANKAELIGKAKLLEQKFREVKNEQLKSQFKK